MGWIVEIVSGNFELEVKHPVDWPPFYCECGQEMELNGYGSSWAILYRHNHECPHGLSCEFEVKRQTAEQADRLVEARAEVYTKCECESPVAYDYGSSWHRGPPICLCCGLEREYEVKRQVETQNGGLVDACVALVSSVPVSHRM